jgi:hypothetical protein
LEESARANSHRFSSQGRHTLETSQLMTVVLHVNGKEAKDLRYGHPPRHRMAKYPNPEAVRWKV